jgi:hypothetical protein
VLSKVYRYSRLCHDSSGMTLYQAHTGSRQEGRCGRVVAVRAATPSGQTHPRAIALETDLVIGITNIAEIEELPR